MEEEPDWFVRLFYFPWYIMGVFLLYIIIKPQSKSDRFFKPIKGQLNNLAERWDWLEQKHGITFENDRKRTINQAIQAKVCRAQKRDSFIYAIEKTLHDSFFMNFDKKWAAFRHASWGIKIIFFCNLLSGFWYVALIYFKMHVGRLIHDSYDTIMHELLMDGLFYAALLFPLSLVLGIIISGMFSLILHVLLFVAFKKGSVQRAVFTSDELLKACKPGGRNTSISIPSMNTSDSFW